MTSHIKSLWNRITLQATPVRAIFEALVLDLALGTCLMFLDLTPSMKNQGVFFLVQPLGALWYSIRLRKQTGGRWRQAITEGALVIALSMTLIAVPLAFSSVTMTNHSANPDLMVVLLTIGLDSARTFVAATILRGGYRLWLVWDRWRRERLVGALTHAHLTVVVIVALIVVTIITIAVTSTNRTPVDLQQPDPTSSVIVRILFVILPVLSFLVVLTAIALVAVIPPSALFSYVFARRTTRRLEALAQVTSAFRAGDYGARVVVGGEDEVARVQSDFNAMADELERTVNDLKVERDKVTGLLESRRQLTASVSHELRTPIATIRGYLESALGHQDSSAPEIMHDLKVMEQETLRLQQLIEDLFTLSRSEASGLALQIAPCDVTTIVSHCTETLAPLAWRSAKVVISTDIAPHLPQVMADEARLLQVIHNLLRNAIQHTRPGDMIVISADAEADAVLIQVKDTGEGIPPEDLPHIWERFYRGSRQQTSDGNAGAGLGLAIVKELVEAMGGTVGVESSSGAGSCFHVTLPRVSRLTPL